MDINISSHTSESNLGPSPADRDNSRLADANGTWSRDKAGQPHPQARICETPDLMIILFGIVLLKVLTDSSLRIERLLLAPPPLLLPSVVIFCPHLCYHLRKHDRSIDLDVRLSCFLGLVLSYLPSLGTDGCGQALISAGRLHAKLRRCGCVCFAQTA